MSNPDGQIVDLSARMRAKGKQADQSGLAAAQQQREDALNQEIAANTAQAANEQVAATYFRSIFGFSPSDLIQLPEDTIHGDDPYAHHLQELKRASVEHPYHQYGTTIPIEGTHEAINAIVWEGAVQVPDTDVVEIITCQYNLGEDQHLDIFTRKQDGTWLQSQMKMSGLGISIQPTEQVNQSSLPFLEWFGQTSQQIVSFENPITKRRREHAHLKEVIMQRYSGEEQQEHLARLDQMDTMNERMAQAGQGGHMIQIDRYQVGPVIPDILPEQLFPFERGHTPQGPTAIK